MKQHPLEISATEPIDVRAMARGIRRLQKKTGEIPWSVEGKTDPWDHVESAMGLTVAGFYEEARRAFAWSAATQLEDGSWWAEYRNSKPSEMRHDPNMSSYIAVGVLHYYLVTGDKLFVSHMWNCVEKAVDFAVGLQGPDGAIFWSKTQDGAVEKRALLTGSASIYLSIRSGLALASAMGVSRPKWEFAARKLGQAIAYRPDLFDMSKSRYSMDWYYPILCSAVTGDEAHERFDEFWDEFVVKHWGARCVSDRPWVTMAESSELIMALCACGRFGEAEKLFSWIKGDRFDDGLYWTGVTVPDSVIWPEERTSWTTAAVLLAADSLYGWTSGANVFSHAFWQRKPNALPVQPARAAQGA